MIDDIISTCMTGQKDSDRHLITLFAIALASKGKTYVELGVREGNTTKPLLDAATLNCGELWSVDIQDPVYTPPLAHNHHFHKQDALEFLSKWPADKKMDVVFVDDWHSYEHVKQELEYLDRYVGPGSVILLHDLMYGNTEPFYHCDLANAGAQWDNGGPYRAVAELNPQFWEWSTLPWNNGLTILRKKYSNRYFTR